jgi:hypothetical protein
MLLKAKSKEIVQVGAGPNENIAAPAPVPPRRTASRNELLPPKSNTAIPAITGCDKNLRAINKHGRGCWNPKAPDGLTQLGRSRGTIQRLFSFGQDVNELAQATPILKGNPAISQGKECVILPTTNIATRLKRSSPLTDQN